MALMTAVYVSIGNSDDKLTQVQWRGFTQALEGAVRAHANRIYGVWFSASDSYWQNMCIAAELRDGYLPYLRDVLAVMAREYLQDSIALAVVADTEFIGPAAAEAEDGFSEAVHGAHGGRSQVVGDRVTVVYTTPCGATQVSRVTDRFSGITCAGCLEALGE